MKVLIRSDVFDIANRVKKFDPAYRVVFDVELNRYQIYSIKLHGAIELIGWTPLSYVCTLPYDELDARAIQYLYDTSTDNLEKIIKSIDDANKHIENETTLKIKQQSLEYAENILRQLS